MAYARGRGAEAGWIRDRDYVLNGFARDSEERTATILSRVDGARGQWWSGVNNEGWGSSKCSGSTRASAAFLDLELNIGSKHNKYRVQRGFQAN